MMQLINRWSVRIGFTDSNSIEFEVNTNFYSVVLQQVSSMSFGTRIVSSIEIRMAKQEAANTGTFVVHEP